MARIKNIDLPNDKRIEVALTYIHGIGRKLSRQILTKLNIIFLVVITVKKVHLMVWHI